MRVAEPEYLYLLFLLIFLIILWIISDRIRLRQLKKFGNPKLLEKIGVSLSSRFKWQKRMVVLAGLGLIIFSLARPQWGAKLTRVERRGVDLMIAIDTSKSMLAQDIKPSRLEKAKFELSHLIDLLEGDRVGIVCFAGTAFTLCPLTTDYSAVKLFLQSITPEVVPQPGTCLTDAIEASLENFNPEEKKYKVILLLTDGEDHCKELGRDPKESAKKAKEQGAVIYTIGIGSPEGSPIPLVDETGQIQYKRDNKGELILTRLDEETLREIALITGGKYYHSRAGELEVERIYQEIRQMEKKKFGEELQVEYEERFQYFLGAGILLLFISGLMPEGKR